jgi:phosphatidylinositol glycan class V
MTWPARILFLHFINSRHPDLPLSTSPVHNVAYHAILIANLSHLLSVFVLYRLAVTLPLGKKASQAESAFIAAALHVLSPAGLFMSAPYAESLCSLLNFLGQLLYVYSHGNRPAATYSIINDIALISSGICFGLATTVRSNGLFSGLILLYDAVLWLGMVLDRFGVSIPNIGLLPSALQEAGRLFPTRRIAATIIAGLLVGIGFVTPQFVAWFDYCGPDVDEKAAWCNKFPPSIYSWVQSHYWYVAICLNGFCLVLPSNPLTY